MDIQYVQVGDTPTDDAPVCLYIGTASFQIRGLQCTYTPTNAHNIYIRGIRIVSECINIS